MKPITGALARALAALGLDVGVARAAAIRVWPAVAAGILGEEGAVVRAVRVDGDTLVVVAPSSSHAAEVRLRERDLIDGLELAAPGNGVRRVRCAQTDS